MHPFLASCYRDGERYRDPMIMPDQETPKQGPIDIDPMRAMGRYDCPISDRLSIATATSGRLAHLRIRLT